MQNRYIKAFTAVIVIIMIIINQSMAGTPLTDMQILASKTPCSSERVDHNEVSFMKIQSDNWFLRYNPITLTLTGLMYVYQRFISPQMPGRCLYSPTCSGFSRQLINEFGIIRGIVFTSDRLMRCNRLAALDIHPLLIQQGKGIVIESTNLYCLPCGCD